MSQQDVEVTDAEEALDAAEGGQDDGAPAGTKLSDLEREGDIAADYVEGLLDIADLDGDIDMDVEGDRAIVSVMDVLLTFPFILLAILVSAVLGVSLQNAIIAVTLSILPKNARLIRSQTLSLKHREFVVAARLGGAGPLSIILRHLLPNVLPTALIVASTDVGLMITLTAGLTLTATASLTANAELTGLNSGAPGLNGLGGGMGNPARGLTPPAMPPKVTAELPVMLKVSVALAVCEPRPVVAPTVRAELAATFRVVIVAPPPQVPVGYWR